jgi:hypothetical protein
MGGHSTLEDNLVDDLVGDVIDDLRAELYESMGTRQHKVSIVRRTWSGPERGEGAVVSEEVAVISPPPLFQSSTQYRLTPAGRDEQGDARLTEVSLRYSEEDLLGGSIPGNVEFFYVVEDMRGQGIAPAFYVPNGRCQTDREQSIGWTVYLNRARDLQEPSP